MRMRYLAFYHDYIRRLHREDLKAKSIAKRMKKVGLTVSWRALHKYLANWSGGMPTSRQIGIKDLQKFPGDVRSARPKVAVAKVTVKGSAKSVAFPKGVGRVVIHYIFGGKGGTGKSFWACLLLEWLKSRGLNAKGMDMDDQSRTFSRIFRRVKRITLQEKDLMMEEALKLSEKGIDAVMVVDAPPRSLEEMSEFFSVVPETNCPQVTFVGWGCLTSDPASLSTVMRWVKEGGSALQGVVFVRNGKDGEAIPCPAPSKLKGFWAKIEVPRVEPNILSRINQANLPLGEALNRSNFLSEREKGTIRALQAQIYGKLDAISSKIVSDGGDAAN